MQRGWRRAGCGWSCLSHGCYVPQPLPHSRTVLKNPCVFLCLVLATRPERGDPLLSFGGRELSHGEVM